MNEVRYKMLNLWIAGKASESDTKQRVSAIHDLKERLKRETDSLKDIKKRLKDVQDKQKTEKEVRW